MKTVFRHLINCMLLALASSAAMAATTVPVGLLNPSGSTSGQVVTSNGASAAPSWKSITFGVLPTMAANTMLGNASASTATPAAVSMPSCSTSTSTLQWTSGTGFTCGTSIDAAQLNSATFAGAFTTLSATGLISPVGSIGIKGTATNDNAQAGSVGEFPSPTNLSGVSLTTSTGANVSSVSLTAGDWDVQCDAQFAPASTTVVQSMIASVSTTSGTVGSLGTYSQVATYSSAASGGFGYVLASPTVRITLASTTTVYCVGYSAFTVSTQTASGFMRARRPR